MRHLKQALALTLSLALALSLAACGGTAAPPAQNTAEDAARVAELLAAPIEGDITVSCYDSNTYKAFLEDAAQRFEALHPGTKVNVETFSAMPEIKTAESGNSTMVAMMLEDDPQGRADYINRVGTALMGGNGADLYAMDVLPIHKYVASGQLEDLSAYTANDPDFNPSDYRQNIFDAVRFGGGTWFLPLDYSFDYYTYDSTLLSGDAYGFGADSSLSASRLLEIGGAVYDPETAAGVFNLAGYGDGLRGGSLLSQLLKENYGDYVNLAEKAANFDDGAFATLLSSIQQYEDEGYVNQTVMSRGEEDLPDMNTMLRGAQNTVTDRYFFKSKNNIYLQSFYNRNSGMQMGFYMGGTNAAVEEDDEIAGVAAAADGLVPFTYTQAYGINSDSKNKAVAWAFLKFLLSEEMQTSTSLSMAGLPVHNAARQTRAEAFFSGSFMAAGGAMMAGPGGQREQTAGGMQGEGQTPPGEGQMIQGPDGGPVTIPPQGEGQTPPDGNQMIIQGPPQGTGEMTNEQRAVLAQYLDAVERMSDQINYYLFRDTIIDDMIAEELQYFFDGSKTAAQVASALQNKASLYLGE